MAYDVISSGPERAPGGRPRRTRTVLVLVLVAAAVAAILLGRSRDDGPAPRPGPSIRPAPVRLGVEVCGVATDHRTTLEVSFALVNPARTGVEVHRVEPALPLGGLRPVTTTAVPGGCPPASSASRSQSTSPNPPAGPEPPAGSDPPAGSERTAPAAQPAESGLPPDGRLRVTFRFALPRSCPVPLPVEVVAIVRSPGRTDLQQINVLRDLGGMAFDTCPSPT